MRSRLIVAWMVLVSTGVPVARSDEPQRQQSSQEAIKDLVGRLGSPRFEDREAAARKLAGMDEAAPALREALASPDAEVRRLAGQALAAHRKRQDARTLARMKAFSRNGEADRLVEALTGLSPSAEDRAGWEAALDLVAAIGGEPVMRLKRPPHDFFLRGFGTPDLPCVRLDGAYSDATRSR